MGCRIGSDIIGISSGVKKVRKVTFLQLFNSSNPNALGSAASFMGRKFRESKTLIFKRRLFVSLLNWVCAEVSHTTTYDNWHTQSILDMGLPHYNK